MKPITVLIVDDSSFIRALFTDLLHDQPDIQVIDTAENAADAREKIKRHNPDVVTLDIEMPGMDGLLFLEKIMSLRPMPVIMASTLTQKGAAETIRALELGAIDYIGKPLCTDEKNTLSTLKMELAAKIRIAARANMGRRHTVAKVGTRPALSYTPSRNAPDIIAIGASTGGVEALRTIFSSLPGNLPPIVIVQHMPKSFTASFAARLNTYSAVAISEAEDGMRLESGHAYIAPGDRHMRVEKSEHKLFCRLDDGQAVSGHRPSVDVLFNSVAELAGPNAVGIVLTGMGKDGAQGLLNMHKAGAYTLGQDEASCVVYGMPKSAYAMGGVCAEFSLNDISAALLRHCEEGRS